MSSYNERTGLIGKARAMDIVCLDFSNTFNTVFLKILIEMLLKYRLNEQTDRQVENRLNDQFQRVMINSTQSSCRPVASSVLQWKTLCPVPFSSSLIIWMMGQSVLSASLQMTQNQVQWLIHQKVVLPFRGILAGCRNGLAGTS